MSSLRVLTVGDNCNVMLYAWRIQQAKSVSLVHVGSSKSGEISVETSQYGSESFRFTNYYESVPQLLSGNSGKEGSGGGESFDLVIMSASSLQEISSLAAQLNPVLNLNTKILVESTGFVHLEPFVKMSIEFSQLKVFSVMSDIDFRQVSPNRYRQFNGNSNGACTFFLGESGVKSAAPSASGGKYPKDNVALLETFKRLFMKLFPRDEIDVCNFSYLDFLSQQWKLALPRICFDPLFILLENTRPSELNEQILAKPLISGLVTEIITVTKSMGARLPVGYDNENDLLQHWLKANSNEAPQLAFHFLRKTAPLNIDMLLLQPILLADDYGIKTPYLEFLYSMMCQYQKLNDGESQWFGRLDAQKQLSDKVLKLEEELSSLNSSLRSSQESAASSKQQYADSLKRKDEQEEQYKAEISSLRTQVSQLKNTVALEQQRASRAEATHRQQLQKEKTPTVTPLPEDQQYTSTGTPILNGFDDIAAYGVQYNASPLQQVTSPKDDIPTSPAIPPSSSGNEENDTVLRERELELRKKELELQEKELELQRRAAANSRPMKFHNGPPFTQPHPQGIPNGHAPRKHSHSQASTRNNRHMHGAAPAASTNAVDPLARHMHGGIPVSSTNMIDPVSAPVQVSSHPTSMSQPSMPAPLQAPMNMHGHHPHQFKSTSRKNRRSNMPNLRHASSVDVLSMAGTGTAPPGAPGSAPGNSSGVKLNSMLGNAPPPMMSNRFQNSSGAQLNNLGNVNAPASRSNQALVGGGISQQRQVSASTMIADKQMQANTSSQSVLHSPIAQIGINGDSGRSSGSDGSTPVTAPNEDINTDEPLSFSIAPIDNNNRTYNRPDGNTYGNSNDAPNEVIHDESEASQGFEVGAADSGKKKSKFGLFGKKDKKKSKK